MGKERPKGEARTGHFLAAEMELRVASTQREPDGKNSRVVGFLHGWMQEPGVHLSMLLSSPEASLPGRLSLPSQKRKSIFPINWRKTTGLSLIGPTWVTCPPMLMTGTRGLECS